jgi:hypothetical protein
MMRRFEDATDGILNDLNDLGAKAEPTVLQYTEGVIKLVDQLQHPFHDVGV